MESNNRSDNSLQDNFNSNNILSINKNYENKNESSTVDNNRIIQNDQIESNSRIDNGERIINNNISNVSSINNNGSNFFFNSNNINSLNNNNLSNNEIFDNQFTTNSNYNNKDYNVDEKLNMTKEEMPLKISNIIVDSEPLFQNKNNQVLNDEILKENKNKEEDINSILSEGYEILTNLTNKIKNYQTLMEKSINEEYCLNKSKILKESDIKNVNNSVNYQLVNYLKFRDKFKLTYNDPELLKETDCLCRYCEKNIIGYINIIEFSGNKKIYYCSNCLKKIIDKIKGPLTITFDKTFYVNQSYKEINQEYKSKITQIKINNKIYENNIISFNYNNVPSLLNCKLTIENNGDKKWPSDSKIDINNFCDKNYFSIGHKSISLDIGESCDFEFELKNLNELTPGKYSLVLCVKYSKKKEIFGNINDMIITIFISI